MLSLVLVACVVGPDPSPADVAVLEGVTGVVEGFYGPVWTPEDRLELVRFAVSAGLDTWMYAPKSEPLHRAVWRDPYPPELLAHFADLAEEIRLVFAIAPGLDYVGDSADQQILLDKLLDVYALGVRDFCVLFDDVFGDVDLAQPAAQVALVNQVRNTLPADASLCFASNAYAGSAAEIEAGTTPFDPLLAVSSTELYTAYRTIDASVTLLWTGPDVFSRDLGDVEAFRGLVERPVVLWDNFPVNDGVLANELFLGAAPSRSERLDGVLVNPMLQPQLSKIALWTLGTGESVPDALQVLSDEPGVATLAEHFASHPFLTDTPESEPFLVAQSAGEPALRAAFLSYANHSIADVEPRLRAELDGASQKLRLYGEAGLAHLDGDRGQALALYEKARQIRWKVGENDGGFAASLLASPPFNDRDAFGAYFEAALR